MFYLISEHPQYFQSEYKTISIELTRDLSLLDVARELHEESQRLELSDDEYAEINGYIAELMSEDRLDNYMVRCPDYEEEDPETFEDYWQVYFAFGPSPVTGSCHKINGEIQWVSASQELPEAITLDELVTIPDLPNWGAHHITNTMGVMVRPFTELGDMDPSYLIIWTS